MTSIFYLQMLIILCFSRHVEVVSALHTRADYTTLIPPVSLLRYFADTYYIHTQLIIQPLRLTKSQNRPLHSPQPLRPSLHVQRRRLLLHIPKAHIIANMTSLLVCLAVQWKQRHWLLPLVASIARSLEIQRLESPLSHLQPSSAVPVYSMKTLLR